MTNKLCAVLDDFVIYAEMHGWENATNGRQILLRRARAALAAASQPAPERSELDALRKVNSELIRENARLIAAPQPAHETDWGPDVGKEVLPPYQPAPDREALVEVIRDAIRPGICDTIAERAADALLARGLRLPGGETMAWAVVGEDGEVIPGSIYPTRDEAERVCDYEGERVVRVAIRVVEGGDDAA